MESGEHRKEDTENMEEILEKLCQHRYTEEDPEYKETIATPLAPPPCIENWYTRPRKKWDYSRGRGIGQRGQGYRGGRGGDHYNNRRGYDRGGYNNYRGQDRGGYNNYRGQDRGGYNNYRGQDRGGYNRGQDRGGYNNYRGQNRDGGNYRRDEPSRNMYPGKKHGDNRYEPYRQGNQRGGQSHHSQY